VFHGRKHVRSERRESHGKMEGSVSVSKNGRERERREVKAPFE